MWTSREIWRKVLPSSRRGDSGGQDSTYESSAGGNGIVKQNLAPLPGPSDSTRILSPCEPKARIEYRLSCPAEQKS